MHNLFRFIIEKLLLVLAQAQASSSDPYPSATELGALLAADLRDISGLVKRLGRRQPGGGRSGAEGGDAGGAGGLWAVLSYFQLADMVLWGQVDTAGEGARVSAEIEGHRPCLECALLAGVRSYRLGTWRLQLRAHFVLPRPLTALIASPFPRACARTCSASWHDIEGHLAEPANPLPRNASAAGAREPAVDAQAHQFLSLLKALYRDMQSRGLNSATVRRIRLSIQPLETTYLEVLEAGGQH